MVLFRVVLCCVVLFDAVYGGMWRWLMLFRVCVEYGLWCCFDAVAVAVAVAERCGSGVFFFVLAWFVVLILLVAVVVV